MSCCEGAVSAGVARSRFVYPFGAIELDVLAQPRSELGFGKAALGEGDHGHVLFLVARIKVGAVECEEDAVADMGRALVAVDERMIARQAEGETGGRGWRWPAVVRSR